MALAIEHLDPARRFVMEQHENYSNPLRIVADPAML
jgi:hypothetical protein